MLTVATIAYIDGFNLYFGSLRHTPYKWLNPKELIRLHFPNDTIARVRYFTADISGRGGDKQKAERQQVYMRALRTLPNLHVHKGRYLRTKATRPVVTPPPAQIEIWKDEEKGSDVNLASWMILDAVDRRCETAIVVSNDSDLEMPIRVLRFRFGLKVGVLFPLNPNKTDRKASAVLTAAADFVETVRPGALGLSQLPDPVPALHGGPISKPPGW